MLHGQLRVLIKRWYWIAILKQSISYEGSCETNINMQFWSWVCIRVKHSNGFQYINILKLCRIYIFCFQSNISYMQQAVHISSAQHGIVRQGARHGQQRKTGTASCLCLCRTESFTPCRSVRLYRGNTLELTEMVQS